MTERTTAEVAGEHVWRDLEPAEGEEAELLRLECATGLTGGELEAEPWYHVTLTGYRRLHRKTDHPGEQCAYAPGSECQQGHPLVWRDGGWRVSAWWHWYQGAPDWAGLRDHQDMRTVIAFSEPDTEVYDRDGLWRLIARYHGSGEAECYLCGPGTEYADDHGSEPNPQCELCEGDGFVYIGEYIEAVYALVEPPEGE